MKITTIKIYDDPDICQKPFFRLSFGKGCGLENCNCSPGHWITISNGRILLTVKLTIEEIKTIKEFDFINLEE